MPKTHSIELDTGTLHLELTPGRVPIRRLLGFASRIGSKRKFLLVSKILGKHYPVSPRLMSWSYRTLARSALASGIAGGSLWIGMAETATGLGYGVFEAARHEGLDHALFMQTTRYHLEGLPRLEFDEAHSHATDFFLYYPPLPQDRELFSAAETLVLIDDEISTGRTFSRLIQAYRAVNPRLRKVLIVSLVNFAHAQDRATVAAEAGVDLEWIAIRHGLLRFDERTDEAGDAVRVNASGNGECKKQLLAWPGRLGMRQPVSLAAADMAILTGLINSPSERCPLLVLGTGECNAPAYLLGRELERRGWPVKVQSTTRSPIRPGHDIASVCRFEDNYQDKIDNFIYNLNPGRYRKIILCHETPLCDALLDRLREWQAVSVRIELDPQSSNAKLHFFRPG